MKLDGEFIRLSSVEQNQLDMVENADTNDGSFNVLFTPTYVQNWRNDIDRLRGDNQSLRNAYPNMMTVNRRGFLGIAVHSLYFFDFRMAFQGLRQSLNPAVDAARHEYEQNQAQIDGYRQAVESACRLRDMAANPDIDWPGSEAMMSKLIDDFTDHLKTSE